MSDRLIKLLKLDEFEINPDDLGCTYLSEYALLKEYEFTRVIDEETLDLNLRHELRWNLDLEEFFKKNNIEIDPKALIAESTLEEKLSVSNRILEIVKQNPESHYRHIIKTYKTIEEYNNKNADGLLFIAPLVQEKLKDRDSISLDELEQIDGFTDAIHTLSNQFRKKIESGKKFTKQILYELETEHQQNDKKLRKYHLELLESANKLGKDKTDVYLDLTSKEAIYRHVWDLSGEKRIRLDNGENNRWFITLGIYHFQYGGYEFYFPLGSELKEGKIRPSQEAIDHVMSKFHEARTDALNFMYPSYEYHSRIHYSNSEEQDDINIKEVQIMWQEYIKSTGTIVTHSKHNRATLEKYIELDIDAIKKARNPDAIIDNIGDHISIIAKERYEESQK